MTTTTTAEKIAEQMVTVRCPADGCYGGEVTRWLADGSAERVRCEACDGTGQTLTRAARRSRVPGIASAVVHVRVDARGEDHPSIALRELAPPAGGTPRTGFSLEYQRDLCLDSELASMPDARLDFGTPAGACYGRHVDRGGWHLDCADTLRRVAKVLAAIERARARIAPHECELAADVDALRLAGVPVSWCYYLGRGGGPLSRADVRRLVRSGEGAKAVAAAREVAA